MPWAGYCPVCEGLVSLPHEHHEAFAFHARASRIPASAEDMRVLGRVMQAARIQFAPWADPGWSTEADEEDGPPDMPVRPESQREGGA